MHYGDECTKIGVTDFSGRELSRVAILEDSKYFMPSRYSTVVNSAVRSGWRQRLSSLPILYKVLIANALIVLLGAVIGTYVTVHISREYAVPTREDLVVIFAVAGTVLSLAVNYWVLKAAFEPLDSLERVANSVRKGDFSARAETLRFSDPQLTRFAETFNQTLDALNDDREQLRRLANQVIGAQEEERKRISRELHDETAQVLFAQLLRVTALKSSPNDDVRATADVLENMTVEAIESVRRLALELRPPALDDLGLREALSDYVERFSEQANMHVEIRSTALKERLQSEGELALYRVAQEALTNVLRHAKATHARIDLDTSDNFVCLSIEDNGVGFDIPASKDGDGRRRGIGLFSMEERLSLVGGTLSLSRVDPHGTRIVACVPIGTNVTPTPTHVLLRRDASPV